MTEWKNRIVGSGIKPADQFLTNPDNWRMHPQSQRDAVHASLNTLGWIQQVVENKRTGHLIDGHERVWQALEQDNADVPYIEVDLTEEEEAQALLTLDPISGMAESDTEKLRALLAQVNVPAPGLAGLLASLKATLPDIPQPPAAFNEYNEDNIGIEHTCPKCGYRWS